METNWIQFYNNKSVRAQPFAKITVQCLHDISSSHAENKYVRYVCHHAALRTGSVAYLPHVINNFFLSIKYGIDSHIYDVKVNWDV